MSFQLSIQDQAQIIKGYTDMRRLRKTTSIFMDKSGESIVEVLVAFILLSIMLVAFSQGITSASISEINARQTRNSADKSMILLQKQLASPNPKEGAIEKTTISAGSDSVKSYEYVIDGNTYIVFYPG